MRQRHGLDAPVGNAGVTVPVSVKVRSLYD